MKTPGFGSDLVPSDSDDRLIVVPIVTKYSEGEGYYNWYLPGYELGRFSRKMALVLQRRAFPVAGKKIYWLCFDIENGNPEGRRYLWVCDSREKGRQRVKRHKIKNWARLVGPFPYTEAGA